MASLCWEIIEAICSGQEMLLMWGLLSRLSPCLACVGNNLQRNIHVSSIEELFTNKMCFQDKCFTRKKNSFCSNYLDRRKMFHSQHVVQIQHFAAKSSHPHCFLDECRRLCSEYSMHSMDPGLPHRLRTHCDAHMCEWGLT